MATIRIVSVLTLVALVGYFILRESASACSGPQCDSYILPSLALPLLIVVLAAVTGALALTAARNMPRGAWPAILSACLAIGVLGPVISAAIFRDSPDTFIPVATSLVLLVPLSALLFSFIGGGGASRAA
jgi:hypothetical protein